MTHPAQVHVFTINLEADQERRDLLMKQFIKAPEFSIHIVNGIYGPSFPRTACDVLARDVKWGGLKGTIGCFLSHVKAWEEIGRLTDGYGIVLEDDVLVENLPDILSIDIPEEADIVFLNDRMCSSGGVDTPNHVLPIWQALRRLDDLRSGGPGGDGYLLRPAAALKILAACQSDLFFGHVDGRLIRYATSEHDLAMLDPDSWIGSVIRHHHHPQLVPQLGLIRGFCLSRPLVTHRGIPSSREAGDDSRHYYGSGFTIGQSGISPTKVSGEVVSLHPYSIPIRYWNRINNIGDLINPEIVKGVSGLHPYYLSDTSEEHLLGVGSIFFMANRNSHVWGAGILSPAMSLENVDVEKVHAVRGRLTEKVLREKGGLNHAVAVGDPGIFVDELPEISDYQSRCIIKRKIALIPHYAMVEDDDIVRLAKSLDADILSPRTSSLEFIKEIIASEIIVSQSLHGLVFAEVFGKPSAWITHDDSENWMFKFHDWFSNTLSPVSTAFSLDASPDIIQSSARLSGLNIDRVALRQAFPSFLAKHRKVGISSKEIRSRYPLALKVSENPREPNSPEYYRTLFCRVGEEHSLQESLNAIHDLFDDRVPAFLIFNQQVFLSLSEYHRQRCSDALTDNPEIAYLTILAGNGKRPGFADGPNGLGMRLVSDAKRSKPQCWDGVIFVRSLLNFSLEAPSLTYEIIHGFSR